MNTTIINPLLILLLAVVSHFAAAQNYPRGLPDEPDTLYATIEMKAALTQDLYRSMDAKASLKQYAPYPGWQDFGTCAAFATAYGARTIIEAQKNNWTDRTIITNHAFAPGFIYKICNPDNSRCWGAYTGDLLSYMMKYGVPKRTDFPVECPGTFPSKDAFDKAAPYRIRNFVRLFGEYDNARTKTERVKKSISERNPVVISMICPNSFDKAKGVWAPTESAGDPIHGRAHGRHAMCVVGYDDELYGGAFEILNSWGKSWGNEGFIWIRYADFSEFVYQAFEVLNLSGITPPKPTPVPVPTPAPDPEPVSHNFNGKLTINDLNNKELPVALTGKSRTYALKTPMASGDRFRLYLENSEPAYVYLIGWDKTGSIFKLFPYESGISPALTYSKNKIAIPSETHHIRLDQTVGTDVLALIYTKKPINVDKTIAALSARKSGTIEQALEAVLGSALAAEKAVTYEKNQAAFQAKNIKQTAVLLLFEIAHE